MNIKGLTFAIFGSCALAFSAQAQLVKQETTTPIPRDFTGQRLPRFKNGYVLAYDFDLAKVWAWDRTGKTRFELPLSIPDASHIQISDMAAANDGTVAVSASATDDQGHLAPVIFWITPGGVVSQIIRTAPFGSSQVVFASDGSLWAAGRTYTLDGSKIVAAAQYDILRRYDSQGRLQQTCIPNTTFAAAPTNPALGSFLAGNQDRIGFLSTIGKEYVEVSLAGAVLGRWPIVSPLSENEASGVALTSSGALYMSTANRSNSRDSNNQGPPLYQLDKSTGTFQPVKLSITSVVKPTVLLGGDGDKLVFYSKPPASVSWFSFE